MEVAGERGNTRWPGRTSGAMLTAAWPHRQSVFSDLGETLLLCITFQGQEGLGLDSHGGVHHV